MTTSRVTSKLTGIHSSRPRPDKDAGAPGKREKRATAKPCADPFLHLPYFPLPSLPLPSLPLP